MKYIKRDIEPYIITAIQYFPVIVISGPRQTGKTTLAKSLFSKYAYFNFENLSLKAAASSDPIGFLKTAGENVILDEVQNIPEILSYIQVAVDDNPQRRYVLTGSNNFTLLEKVSQSLSGRCALFTLLPLSLNELQNTYALDSTEELLIRGLYPAVYSKGTPANLMYSNYYSTYIERDLRKVFELRHLTEFQLFMKLLSGRIGNEFNASSLGIEVGVSPVTIREWFSLLQASYIAFPLRPYHTNIGKRLTKTPKVYFYDTGLVCYLLGIETPSQLFAHPLKGNIFENLAVNEFVKLQFNRGKDNDLYFYRENSGREVDIVQPTPDGLKLYEIKSSKTYNDTFRKNLDAVSKLLGAVNSQVIIYDGATLTSNIINVRDIVKSANQK